LYRAWLSKDFHYSPPESAASQPGSGALHVQL
jgi:hypothetical protein